MKESFTQAYDSLIKLKSKERNKVCFIFSSHLNRVKQLVDYFEIHSNYSVKRFSLSEIAMIILSDEKTLKADAKENAASFLKKSKPEYIILEDKEEFPKNLFLLEDLCEVIREVGKIVAVIIVSEHPGKLLYLCGDAIMVCVPGLNEYSLKIKPSSLQTEKLYLQNQCEAVRSGIFLANDDFYINFIENKMSGDLLFAQDKYREALEKYYNAISFHIKFDRYVCQIYDFLRMTLFVRCIACFLYSKWPEQTNTIQYMKESVCNIMTKLKKSELEEFHGEMLKSYDLTFWGIKEGRLKKNDYLLFLNEYIF